MNFTKYLPIYLFLVGLLVACNIYTLIPLYPVLSHQFSNEQSAIAIGSSLFTLSYGVGLLVFGSLVTRFAHKHIILFGMAFAFMTSILVGFSSSVEELYITRTLQGFSLGSFAPVAFSLCYAWFTGKILTIIITALNTSFLIAGIVGQLWSSYVSFSFSWPYVYLSFALVYCILFILGIPSLPLIRPSVKIKQPSFIEIGTKIPLLFCYMIVFTLLASIVGYYDALQRSFTGPSSELFFIRFIGLIGILPSLFNHIFIERIGLYKTFCMGLLLGCGGFATVYFTTSTVAFYLSSITIVAAISILIPTIILLIGTIEVKYRTRAISLYSFILLMGASFSPVLNNWLSFSQSMLLYTCSFLINFLLLWRISLSLSRSKEKKNGISQPISHISS